MNSHAADDIYRPVPLMPVLPKTPTSLYMAMALFSICAPALDDVVGPERVSFQRVVFEIHLLTCRQLLSRRIVCSALAVVGDSFLVNLDSHTQTVRHEASLLG